MPEYPAKITCKRCGKKKPNTDFYRTKGKWLQQPCKKCYVDRRKDDPDFRAGAVKYAKTYRRKLREEAIAAYGGACACCGEQTYEFLALDHVGGGGRQHRARRAAQVYYDAKKEGYPPTYRLLCHNCNSAFGFYGYCPHQE